MQKIARELNNSETAFIFSKDNNDYDVHVNQMKFSVLNNGLVRAKGKNFGENSQVDFKVQCDGKNCQIDDIYTPDSYKKEVIAIVKNNQC